MGREFLGVGGGFGEQRSAAIPCCDSIISAHTRVALSQPDTAHGSCPTVTSQWRKTAVPHQAAEVNTTPQPAMFPSHLLQRNHKPFSLEGPDSGCLICATYSALNPISAFLAARTEPAQPWPSHIINGCPGTGPCRLHLCRLMGREQTARLGPDTAPSSFTQATGN